MKGFFCASGLLAAVGFIFPTAQAVLTARQKIAMFDAEDFAFSLGGPEPAALVDGYQLRAVGLGQLPALEGQGISVGLVNLDACTINLPHVHPRAAEMLYVIEGAHLRAGFVEENGGEGAVINDLSKGDVTFIPQGLIHYQQNLDCEPATFLAALNSEDGGSVAITSRFAELPTEAIQASLNLDPPAIQALIASLPDAPGSARLSCLERCGLLPMDDDEGYSYRL